MDNLYLKKANRLYRVKNMHYVLIYQKELKKIINNNMINMKNKVRVINSLLKQLIFWKNLAKIIDKTIVLIDKYFQIKLMLHILIIMLVRRKIEKTVLYNLDD